MGIWKKALVGVAMSAALVGASGSLVSAQEPASLTGYVSICSADLTSCESVQGVNVYFDVNNDPEKVVQTNAAGEASIEVTTGDEVAITVDPNAIEGATIAPDSQAGYVVSSVNGSEQTFNFVFVLNQAPAATATTTAAATTATASLPTAGVGPQGPSGSNTGLLLAVAGSALAAGAAGVAMRKRSASN